MDLLRLFIAVWAIIVLFSTVVTILGIGQKREPLTAGGAGCVAVVNMITFVGFLLVWQRLGS